MAQIVAKYIVHQPSWLRNLFWVLWSFPKVS